MVCVRIVCFQNLTIPYGMEIPRLTIVGVDRLTEELHLHIISTKVVIISGMKRLMQVTDKVDEILEVFLTLLIVGAGLARTLLNRSI